MSAAIDRIVPKLRRLEALDPKALRGAEILIDEAIDLRDPREKKGAGTLEVRLKRVHPGCDGPFIQQPPHNGRRSWRCDQCGHTFALDGGPQ